MSRPIKTAVAALFVAAALTASGLRTASAAASKAHFLMAFDTNDKTIGRSCAIDRDNLMRTLLGTRTFRGSNDRMSWTILSGRSCTKRNIMNHYRALSVRSGDTVFFYYSGHGGRSASTGHFLALPDGLLDRTVLRKAMRKAGGRQTILLTDCCANLVDVKVFEHSTRTRPNARLLSQLLFQQRGLTDVVSAKKSHYAFGNNEFGGYFTSSFWKNLYEPISLHDRDRNGFVTWKEFIASVSRDAHSLFKKTTKGSSRITQRSHYAWRIYLNRDLQVFQRRKFRVKNDTGTTLFVELRYLGKDSDGKWRWHNPTQGSKVYKVKPRPDDVSAGR